MAIPRVVEKTDKLPDNAPAQRDVDNLEVVLDTPWDSILQCEKKGGRITFSDEPGRFKRLSNEQLDQLHRVTQAAYLVSERYHQAALDKASNPRAVLTDIRQESRATDRLYVGNKKPDLAYSWKRPDEHQRAVGYEGWKVETDSKLETFRRPEGGAYTVGAKGDVELILFSRPKALHDAHLREATEKSENRRNAVQKQAAAGDKLVFEEDNPVFDAKGRNWEDVAPSKEST